MLKKTAVDFVEYLKSIVGSPYWYGCMGEVADETLYLQKRMQFPVRYMEQDYISQYGKRVYDDTGIIKGFLMDMDDYGRYIYKSEYDLTEMGFWRKSTERGKIETFKFVPGALLYTDGHIGVYVGKNKVIQALNHQLGVAETEFDIHAWMKWSLCPFLSYLSVEAESVVFGKDVSECDKTLIVTIDKLNCRNVPSMTKSHIVGLIKKNQVVKATHYDINGWYRIEVNGKNAWCRQEYLKEITVDVPYEDIGIFCRGREFYADREIDYYNYPIKVGSVSLGKIKAKTKITVEKYYAGWYLVSSDCGRGWVYRTDFLRYQPKGFSEVTSDYLGKYIEEFRNDGRSSMSFDSNGHDWDLSAGRYRFTLRFGTCIKFLKMYFEDEARSLYFIGPKEKCSMWPGEKYCSSPTAVKEVWTHCFNKYGKEQFQANERDFIYTRAYFPLIRTIRKKFNPSNRNRAFQECFFSWVLDRGISGTIDEFTAITAGVDLSKISDEELLDRLYDGRYMYSRNDAYLKDAPNSEREMLRGILTLPPLEGYTCVDLPEYVVEDNTMSCLQEIHGEEGHELKEYFTVVINAKGKDCINYRVGPAAYYAAIGTIKDGESVIATRRSNIWYFIKKDEESECIGWISSEYFKR